MIVNAPAKLNLFLRVLGRRSDGYHEIETVFERIDLADALTFEPHERRMLLSCSDPSLSCGDDNLVVKAAALLRQITRTAYGARVHLIKRIPIAAGMGGGSSDAAAALRGLNELWGLGLGLAQLQVLAAQLGSDVPFFLTEAPCAIGRGRGERCEPLQQGVPLAHVLVVPDARLSTPEIYEEFHRTPVAEAPSRAQHAGGRPIPSGSSTAAQNRILSGTEGFGLTASSSSITMVAHALRNGSLGELAQVLWNDLEPGAIRRCPQIETIRLRLQEAGCLAARMSGSGPSVFGLCRDRLHAEAVAATVRDRADRSWRIAVVQTDSPDKHENC